MLRLTSAQLHHSEKFDRNAFAFCTLSALLGSQLKSLCEQAYAQSFNPSLITNALVSTFPPSKYRYFFCPLSESHWCGCRRKVIPWDTALNMHPVQSHWIGNAAPLRKTAPQAVFCASPAKARLTSAHNAYSKNILKNILQSYFPASNM